MIELSSIKFFLVYNSSKLPKEKLGYLQKQLLNTTAWRWDMIRFLPLKDPNILLLISCCVGYFGIDRFLLENYTIGIIKLIVLQLSIVSIIPWILLFLEEQTNWIFLCKIVFCIGVIWWIYDLCTIRRKTQEYNYKLIIQTLN